MAKALKEENPHLKVQGASTMDAEELREALSTVPQAAHLMSHPEILDTKPAKAAATSKAPAKKTTIKQ